MLTLSFHTAFPLPLSLHYSRGRGEQRAFTGACRLPAFLLPHPAHACTSSAGRAHYAAGWLANGRWEAGSMPWLSTFPARALPLPLKAYPNTSPGCLFSFLCLPLLLRIYVILLACSRLPLWCQTFSVVSSWISISSL